MQIVREKDAILLTYLLYNGTNQRPILSSSLNVLIYGILEKKQKSFEERFEKKTIDTVAFKNQSVTVERCLISKNWDSSYKVDSKNYFIPLKQKEKNTLREPFETVEFDKDNIYIKPKHSKDVKALEEQSLIVEFYKFILMRQFSISENLDLQVLTLKVLSYPFLKGTPDITQEVYEKLSVILSEKNSIYKDYPCVDILKDSTELRSVESRIIFNTYIDFYNALSIENRFVFKRYFEKSTVLKLS